ncbi:MAG: hypothetical protein ACFFC7_24750 [Candidatus Hermodarchaeota archaeon]
MGGYDWIDAGIEKGKKLPPEQFKKPYALYGFSVNPFNPNMPLELPETMVPSKEWLSPPSGFLIRIGSSIQEFKRSYDTIKDDLGRGYHLLAYAPTGYGKTTLAKVITKQQRMRNKDNIDSREHAIFVNVADWLSEDPDALKPQLNYRKWSEEFFTRIQEQKWQTHDIVLLIIDNLALLSGKTPDIPHIENFLEDFYTETKKCPLIVGFMKTSEWLYLKQLTDVDSRHFLEFFQSSKVQLNPFSYNEIEKLLVKRLQATKTEKTSSDLLHPFSQSILRHISNHSLGIPQIALTLASRSLAKWALEDNKHKMEKGDIDTLIRSSYLDLATRLVKGKEKLPRKQMDVLWEVFLNTIESRLMPQRLSGVTNKAIASKFGVRMSAISYHFKQLTDRTLLRSRSDPNDARSQLYYIQEPIFTGLEIYYDHFSSFQQFWTSIELEEGSD